MPKLKKLLCDIFSNNFLLAVERYNLENPLTLEMEFRAKPIKYTYIFDGEAIKFLLKLFLMTAFHLILILIECQAGD